MSAEHNVKHLWDCALALNAETHSKKLLKSYITNVCRKVAGANRTSDSDIPLERFAPSQMCERCSMHWQENEFQMKLKPQTLHLKTNKARRLIAKLKAQESGKEQRLLTKKQKKRAKWLLKHAESKVVIKCEFCEHKTLVPLNKPDKQKSEEKNAKRDVETSTVSVALSKSKKKKKKKDTTAGLKIPKPMTTETQEKPPTKSTKTTKDKSGSQVAKVPSKNLQIQKTNSTKSKPKSINKKEVPKIQSKTQKQNSLLQLAALLKIKDQTKPLSSSKNRLESLLE